MSVLKKIRDVFHAIQIWSRLTVHNTWGIFNVFFIVWVRPMKGGLLEKNNSFLEIEFYKTRSKTLSEMYFDIKMVRWRYGWIFSLLNLYYRILKLFRPHLLVR